MSKLSASSFLRWSVGCLLCFTVGVSAAAVVKTYTDHGDGTVTDPTTGLMWMRCAMGQTWQNDTCTGTAATTAVTTTTFAGHSDWRLPNIRDLLSLVDRTMASPAIDTKAFPAAPALGFWTSTPIVIGHPQGWEANPFWRVNFGYGVSVAVSAGTSVHATRLVRGTALPLTKSDTAYTENGDGTVTDIATGLVWQRCAVGQSWAAGSCSGTPTQYAWKDARGLTSSLGGNTDWRIPTVAELLTLVDYERLGPALHPRMFPNAPTAQGALFFSSTPVTGFADSAWVVDAFDGTSHGNPQGLSAAVRMVRGGKQASIVSLTVLKTGDGTVRSSALGGVDCGETCAGEYSSGTRITLTAEPAWRWAEWGGACSGTATTCTVTLDASKTVTARFHAADTTTQAFPVCAGWNLLGNGSRQPLAIDTLFGQNTAVSTVWAWNAAGLRWRFYTPLMDAAALRSHAASKGYDVLTQIDAGQGFWVNTTKSFVLNLPSGTSVVGQDFQPGQTLALRKGFTLAAVGQPMTPRMFNHALNTLPMDPGVVPNNLLTLWAWDHPSNRWYFYAPSLDAEGGDALQQHIDKARYLDFTAASKTLGHGVGFWVNIP
ncbi:DUF1566 domain-containing protein [Candidatus Symbiobacter mobilis]|uniref:Uncharacterized protein n=1 Tax=Candidatus Symbiobacter mobilis CR TaxID=946483 RepID=U5N6N3_9BURK|nr:DUF1566 domain-containing protein [Candidatus Symbiobacter mobilis]AGX87201.1 hypothetical protein Cenrod_1108 [Candidatus Symbiobacter mobilis CR]